MALSQRLQETDRVELEQQWHEGGDSSYLALACCANKPTAESGQGSSKAQQYEGGGVFDLV